MRMGKVAMLAITSGALFACSSGTSQGALSFTIAESLLVLEPDDATVGYVLLSSAVGNCPALQSGLQPVEIGNTSYLLIIFEQLDSKGHFAPLTAGTYNILDLSSSTSPTPPALIAFSSVVQTDSACSFGGSDATGGTATLSPFNTADGGTSTLTYSADYNGTQLTGPTSSPPAWLTCLPRRWTGDARRALGPETAGPAPSSEGRRRGAASSHVEFGTAQRDVEDFDGVRRAQPHPLVPQQLLDLQACSPGWRSPTGRTGC